MLGSAVFSLFSQAGDFGLTGTIRSKLFKKYFPTAWHQNIVPGIDILDDESLVQAIDHADPDVARVDQGSGNTDDEGRQ